ncbi:hypothetical protein [Xanthomonas cissicola]|nr:hypothetical protein [Xanthomonas cissicola]
MDAVPLVAAAFLRFAERLRLQWRVNKAWAVIDAMHLAVSHKRRCAVHGP